MPSVNANYEVSSEGAVRHWEIPYARLTNTSPTATHPAEVSGRLTGRKLTGTVLTLDASRSIAVVDFTASMVYWQEVRNVLTYSGGAEATWGAINIGDPVYYDPSGTMPSGVYLSTSPQNSGGTANTLFGYVVPANENDLALFPKGGATASTQRCAIMQVGAGG